MHGLGQQAQRAYCRALDRADGGVAVQHVQQFIAPAAQAVGLAQQLRGLFEHSVQFGAGREGRADAQRVVVGIDVIRAVQRVARGMRGPAAAPPRYI